jgi:2,3-bisphosphoglycerate-independent phosphoglycerate mutase
MASNRLTLPVPRFISFLLHIPDSLVLETEKYAHVTFFFNGGVEKQFEDEERHMIASPKVATYDKDPKMSVQEVADKVAELVRKSEHEFIMCNFAPPDMVCSFFPQ